MNQPKWNPRMGLLMALFLVLYNVLAFTLALDRSTPVFWLAFGGMYVSFFLTVCGYVKATRKGEGTRSRLLGWPMRRTALTMAGLHLALTAALMLLGARVPVAAAVALEALLLALTAVSLFLWKAEAAAEAAGQTDAEAWKAIHAKAAAIASATGNAQLKKLAEEIRLADPAPTDMDGRISAMLDTLSGYATAENIQKALQLVRQRAAAKQEKP